MNSNRARAPLRLPSPLTFFLAVVLWFPPTVVMAAVDIEEVWIQVYHARRDGTDHGYIIEVGLDLEVGSDVPTSLTITPEGGEPYNLVWDIEEWVYFDTGEGEFDPSPGAWTGSAHSFEDFNAAYPGGTWTLAVTQGGGPPVNYPVPFELAEPIAYPAIIFPGHATTIDTGKPVIMFSNDCTDCDLYEAELASTDGDSVEKEFESYDLPLSAKPNAVAFAEFDFNEGTSGTVDADGLAAGQYQASVALAKGSWSPVGGVEGADEDGFNLYVAAYGYSTALFDVSGDTSSNASLAEVGLTMRHVEQAPDGGSLQEGWHFDLRAEGENLNDVAFYRPGSSSAIPLLDDGDGKFRYEEHLGSANSRGEAFGVYEPTDGYSKYVLVVDGGKAMATLDFFSGGDEGPNAGFSFVDPVDGDTVSTTPTFDLEIDCTNCTQSQLILVDVATEGEGIFMVSSSGVEAGLASVAFPDDFSANEGSGGTITSLPAGDYVVAGIVLRLVFSDLDFANTLARSGSDSTFLSATGEDVERYMVVPEPGAAALHLGALASLAGIAQWRRRRST